jgi:hypothetical protein
MSALEEIPAAIPSGDTTLLDIEASKNGDQSSKEVNRQRKSILDRFGEKLKEFLDNA